MNTATPPLNSQSSYWNDEGGAARGATHRRHSGHARSLERTSVRTPCTRRRRTGGVEWGDVDNKREKRVGANLFAHSFQGQKNGCVAGIHF